MKVLFFIESLRAGGKERRIIELLKGLTQHPEVEIELVLTRREIHYQEVYNLNVPIHIIERKFFKKDPLLFFKFYWIVKNFKPDIIHVWGNMVAVYSLPAVKLLRIPLLNNQITDATPNQKPLGKDLVFKHSTRIIANTQAGLVAYNAPPEKSGVIYNGFNFSRLEKLESPAAVRQRFNIATPFVTAMVATFSPYKDYTTYLKAAINILQKRKDVTFLCVGDGNDAKFKAMVPDGLQQYILFLGKQNNVESIMNACDMGILMTDVKNHAEGISNALLEFMALGKPVLATNFGGSTELVVDNITGYLIEPYGYNQLEARITELLNDTGQRKTMGNRGKERIHHHFSIENMIRSFYKEYEKLIKIPEPRINE